MPLCHEVLCLSLAQIYCCAHNCVCGSGSLVGIATDYDLDGPGSNPVGTRFSAHPERPWCPPSLLYNVYQVFPGGKVRPGRAADHSPPSSAAVMEE